VVELGEVEVLLEPDFVLQGIVLRTPVALKMPSVSKVSSM
jgi:hypothetical protein